MPRAAAFANALTLALALAGCATTSAPAAPPADAAPAAAKLAAPSPPPPPESCGDAGDVLGGAALAARLEADAGLEPPALEKTPCALLRLARLRAAEARAAWDVAGNQGAPALAPSLAHLTRLVQSFPAWAQLDEALVELANLQGLHGDAPAALRSRLALVCPGLAPDPLAPAPLAIPAGDTAFAGCAALRPDSPQLPAAWIAVADGLAEDRTLLAAAPSAYARALEELSPDDPAQPLVLYRRGLVLQRLGRHAEAAAQLVELLLAPGGAAVRQDALGYLALATTAPDWNHDGAADAALGLDRPELQAHLQAGAYWLPELVERVGDLHRDATEWPRANAAYSLFVARWPQHPRAAAVAEKLGAVRQRQGPAAKPGKGASKARPAAKAGKRGKRAR